jgi:hypothetical protein
MTTVTSARSGRAAPRTVIQNPAAWRSVRVGRPQRGRATLSAWPHRRPASRPESESDGDDRCPMFWLGSLIAQQSL